MKKVFERGILLTALLVILFACHPDEGITPTTGNVNFSIPQAGSVGGRVSEASDASFVVLTLRSKESNIQQTVKLALFPFGQGYTSESLGLQTGSYELSQFLVLDATERVILASPYEKSSRAILIADPLPLEFVVTLNGTTSVTPGVLAVTASDTPADFGYATFGFDINSDGTIVLIKTNVKLSIGNILYENIDAIIRISGYSANNQLQWAKDFEFTGPEDNIFPVQYGFHHYQVLLVNKWGISDVQSDLTGEDIWSGRADGPLPITYVLAGSVESKLLSEYVGYDENFVQGKGLVYEPDSRVKYSYNSTGQVEFIRYEAYDSQNSRFVETSFDAFYYQASVLSRIAKTVDGKLHSEFLYEYGVVNKITQILHFDEGLVCLQSTTTNADQSHVEVAHKFSNGNSFIYEFENMYKNILKDRTTQSGQLCNNGQYVCDKNINPFRQLGYMDFNFQNWSVNNKLNEDIHYVSCGYPSIIPVSHSYTYDVNGYPVEKISSYKTDSFDGAPNQQPLHHRKTEFYYR